MKKETKQFYFSVEGDTEKWYFEWLQKTINSDQDKKYAIKLNVKKEKNPISMVKSLSILHETEITHVFDRESEEEKHIQQFRNTLDAMKGAEEEGKAIKYQLGYTNFTFELWIILHKADCTGQQDHRGQYLKIINKVYNEKFKDLDDYKQEKHFKRLLDQLTIADVKEAIEKAKLIMKNNKKNGYKLQEYNGYTFYKENPSLSLWESVDTILKECEI